MVVTVSRTGNAQTDRTRSTVTRQADDADIVSLGVNPIWVIIAAAVGGYIYGQFIQPTE